MIDVVRGVLRVRKWPRKRGKPKSESQRYWIDWFKQANLLAKYADAYTQVRAKEITAHTGMYPRDIILAAMRGRLYTWVDETGWRWYPVAAIQDISESLDVLGQTVGDILVRALDRWRPVVPGAPGEVLTNMGAGAPAQWQPAGGGGGLGQGAMVRRDTNFTLVNGTNVAIPWESAMYDTVGAWALTPNPTRLTVPVGMTWATLRGYYALTSNSVGIRQIWIQKNGATFPGGIFDRRGAGGTSGAYFGFGTGVVPCVAGDYFEVLFYQNSGASRSIGITPDVSYFAAEFG